MTRYNLILIEGCDGAGKSTLCKGLAEAFGGKAIAMPRRETKIGQRLNKVLNGTEQLSWLEQHELFSANRWESVDLILNELKSRPVFLDRYSYSGIAYTLAQHGQNLDIESRKELESKLIGYETGLPAPDLIIYIDTSIDTLMNRKGFGDEILERRDIQTYVAKEFKNILTHAINISGEEPEKDVLQKAIDLVNPFLGTTENPVQGLFTNKPIDNTIPVFVKSYLE